MARGICIIVKVITARLDQRRNHGCNLILISLDPKITDFAAGGGGFQCNGEVDPIRIIKGTVGARRFHRCRPISPLREETDGILNIVLPGAERLKVVIGCKGCKQFVDGIAFQMVGIGDNADHIAVIGHRQVMNRRGAYVDENAIVVEIHGLTLHVDGVDVGTLRGETNGDLQALHDKVLHVGTRNFERFGVAPHTRNIDVTDVPFVTEEPNAVKGDTIREMLGAEMVGAVRDKVCLSLAVADRDEVNTLFVGDAMMDCAGGADDQTAGVGANFDRVGVCPVDGIQVENCVVHCFNLLSISNIQLVACILWQKSDKVRRYAPESQP